MICKVICLIYIIYFYTSIDCPKSNHEGVFPRLLKKYSGDLLTVEYKIGTSVSFHHERLQSGNLYHGYIWIQVGDIVYLFSNHCILENQKRPYGILMMSSKKKLGELIYTLEDHIYDEASDAFEKLYDETDPGKMVEEVLDIVHICKWDTDYDDMIRDYFGLAESEHNSQAFFQDGNESLSKIYKEMIRDQFCWIGILYKLEYDVSSYVSDIMDALENNSDEFGFENAITSIMKALRKDIENGEPGKWFS